MIRTTGGSEFAATSTRSRSRLSAYSIASLMCLIPSCSPLSEMRRTERALIWPLILVSSSAATLHHSFQYGLCGAVEPRTTASQTKHRKRTRTPTHAIYYTPTPLPSSRLVTRRDLRAHAPRELFDPHGLLCLLAALADVHRPLPLLCIPDDEEVRHLLPGVLPDLLLHAVR